MVVESIKEDILSVVSDLKEKPYWELASEDKEKCDQIIRKMVFNARERDHIGHVYDLTRNVFDIVKSVTKN